MVTDGHLIIDDHQNSPELQEALQETMDQVEIFRRAADKADERDFTEAIELLEESELPEEARGRLVQALETGEWELIDATFTEYKSRLGKAFCESCWSNP